MTSPSLQRSGSGNRDSRPRSTFAVVFNDSCPVQWTGKQAVETLPEHIDASNADQIREELLPHINRGAVTVIADVTATHSCDRASARRGPHGARTAVAARHQS